MEITIAYIVFGVMQSTGTKRWEVLVLCKSGASWSLGCYATRAYAVKIAQRHNRVDNLPVFTIG